MANFYTTFTIALNRGSVPTTSTTFDEIWEIARSAARNNQTIRSTSLRDWVLDIVRVIMDAGHIQSLAFLYDETAVLAPENLPSCISELKALLRELANKPELFSTVLSNKHFCYTAAEIRAACSQQQSVHSIDEQYGDGDGLEYLPNFLQWHLALFQLAFQQSLYIYYIRCEEFLESRIT